MNVTTRNYNWLYILFIALCFLPFISPAVALAIGLVFSFLKFRHQSIHQHTTKVLQASVVMMGFGMNLSEVVAASKSGFVITLTSVSLVMMAGLLLGKFFKIEKNIALLISSGTAICGGSAIAAIAPITGSKDYQISFSLVVVFVLNAVALFVFPLIGHQLGMSQELFGNWAAIAIHDTSSVVGAGAIYGDKALQVATTVKLIRALWIVPLAFVIVLFNKGGDKSSIKFPWFILWFVIAILVAYYVPQLNETFGYLTWLGRRGMVLTLFLIGSNITIDQVRQSGIKSFAFGISLWVLTAVTSLFLLRL